MCVTKAQEIKLNTAFSWKTYIAFILCWCEDYVYGSLKEEHRSNDITKIMFWVNHKIIFFSRVLDIMRSHKLTHSLASRNTIESCWEKLNPNYYISQIRFKISVYSDLLKFLQLKSIWKKMVRVISWNVADLNVVPVFNAFHCHTWMFPAFLDK